MIDESKSVLISQCLLALLLLGCNSTQTRPEGCQHSTDCEPKEVCQRSGRCTPANCSTLGCRPGQVCDDEGTCVAESCTEDGRCMRGFVCEQTACIPDCTQTGCPSASACDPILGRCTPGDARWTCAADADCAPPSTVCASSSLCAPGCFAGACEAWETCGATSGRCELADCMLDTDCARPYAVCDGTTCGPGCATTGCRSTLTCAASGRCEVPLGPVDAPCASDDDCVSAYCFDFGPSLGSRCAATCGSVADCPAGATCDPSVGGARLCLTSLHFDGAGPLTTIAGGTCTTDTECRSGLCLEAVCVDRCTTIADCATSMSCRWEEVGSDVFEELCISPRGLLPDGASCNDDDDCESGECYRGESGDEFCSTLCDSSADCAPNFACIVDDDSDNGRIQTVKICREADVGSGAVGDACSQNDHCRSATCHDVLQQCVDVCSIDADCPATHGCRLEQIDTYQGDPVFSTICLPKRRQRP